jgi:hypothetical protein
MSLVDYIDYDKQIKVLEDKIKELQELQEKQNLSKKIPFVEIDFDKGAKYIQKLKNEKRLFEKGDPDYEESLKHPIGTKKEEWYIKK